MVGAARQIHSRLAYTSAGLALTERMNEAVEDTDDDDDATSDSNSKKAFAMIDSCMRCFIFPFVCLSVLGRRNNSQA